MNEETKVVVVDSEPLGSAEPKNAITEITTGSDDIIQIAETIVEKTEALKKIMTAALRMTSPFDWIIIGGRPYLQESGCTKVGSLLGISFEICPGYPKTEIDSDGYKTFTYRVRAFNKRSYVEGEGSRAMREDFFSKKKEGIKLPVEINERNVMVAAFTNAKANAIKAIIPGLKNIEISTLEQAGLDVSKISGYDFKTGKDGGKKGDEEEFVCESCGAKISGKVASYSKAYFSGHVYCVKCQEKASRTKQKYTGEVVEPYKDGDE